jgi:pimeloyl-ACP methyl ester carboxylesterase
MTMVAGTGLPVVLLHSSLSSKAQWNALIERLAPRFRVIALDLHGYGDNAMPTGAAPFTLDDEVRLVAETIDRIVPPHMRVHLVGHSYGGAVALKFAQRSRGRVASLALYEPVAFRMLDADDALVAEIRRVAESLPRLIAAGAHLQAAEAFVDFWSGPGSFGRFAAPVQMHVARNIGKVPLDFQASMSWPIGTESVRSIAAPVLLLSGTQSPAVAKAIVARLAQALPKRYLGRIDAGHMGPVTAPHLVNPWVEAFIDMCVERATSPATAASADSRVPLSAAAD